MYLLKEAAELLGLNAERARYRLGENLLRPDARGRYGKGGVEQLRRVVNIANGFLRPPDFRVPVSLMPRERMRYVRDMFAHSCRPSAACYLCLCRAVRGESTLLSTMPGKSWHLHTESGRGYWLCDRCARRYKEILTDVRPDQSAV